MTSFFFHLLCLLLILLANLSSPGLAVMIEPIRRLLTGTQVTNTIIKKSFLSLLSLYRAAPSGIITTYSFSFYFFFVHFFFPRACFYFLYSFQISMQ